MAIERFRTLAETTLAGNYTAASGTLTVTSAAAFPSTGNFRIRLGNAGRTVLLVTAVAGAVFTVTAEANDANATTGDDVILVNTAGAMRTLVQAPQSGFASGLYGVDGASAAGPLHQLTALNQTGWAWVNQGTFSVIQAGGVVQLAGPFTGAGANVALRQTTAPAAPYTMTACLVPLIGPGGFTYIAIGHRDAGSGEFKLWIAGDDQGVRMITYNTPTSGNADSASRIPAWRGTPVWMRIIDDNTDLIYQYSVDGINFTTVFQEPRTTFCDPDQIVIAASAEGTFDGLAGGSVLSFLAA